MVFFINSILRKIKRHLRRSLHKPATSDDGKNHQVTRTSQPSVYQTHPSVHQQQLSSQLPSKPNIIRSILSTLFDIVFLISSILRKIKKRLQRSLHKPSIYQTHPSVYWTTEGEGLGKRGKQWVEVLSSEPRAFLYHNFLSKEECEHLINAAQPHMKRSRVFDPNSKDRTKVSSTRTSTGMSLRRGGDKVISDIEKRIADYTSIPVEHGQSLHVLNYKVGQKIRPHYDYSPEFSTNQQKLVTFVMYLSDVEEGGKTAFPNARKPGLPVKPKMGNALLFWNVHPDGTQDLSSMHEGCPVIKGEKWICTKWMHTLR